MEELDKANGISVYVANLGKYNEGELVGSWITLPVPEAELERFLREEVGLELDPQVAFEKGQRGEKVYEEYAIHDYEFDKGLKAIGYRPDEYEPLEDLNILAALMVDKTDDYLTAVRLTLEQECSYSSLEAANLVSQADKIPFYGYCFQGIEYADTWSNEEKLGRTLLEYSPLMETLENNGIEDYFDFESYGEDHSYDLVLDDEGYLDLAQDFPDLDYYHKDELKDLIEDKFEGFFDKDSGATNGPDRTDETVRDWYMRTFLSDNLGAKIHSELTFDDALAGVSRGGGFYEVLGVGDSLVRERVFDELAGRYGIDRGDIYDAWLAEKPLPDVNKTKEAVSSLSDRCNSAKETSHELNNHDTKGEQHHDMDAR